MPHRRGTSLGLAAVQSFAGRDVQLTRMPHSIEYASSQQHTGAGLLTRMTGSLGAPLVVDRPPDMSSQHRCPQPQPVIQGLLVPRNDGL